MYEQLKQTHPSLRWVGNVVLAPQKWYVSCLILNFLASTDELIHKLPVFNKLLLY
jgi:hypothetical protein